jgi:hypothetical protein
MDGPYAATNTEGWLPGLAACPSRARGPLAPQGAKPGPQRAAGWWVSSSEAQTLDELGQPAGYSHKLMRGKNAIKSGTGPDSKRTFLLQAAFLNTRGATPASNPSKIKGTANTTGLVNLSHPNSSAEIGTKTKQTKHKCTMINAIEQTTPSTPTNTTNTTMPHITKAPKATTTKAPASEATTTDVNYQPDDWVTKPQIMAKFGIPNGDRQLVHHAIIRAKLQPASNSKGPKDVRFRFADAVALFERGAFTRKTAFVAKSNGKAKADVNDGTASDVAAVGVPIDDTGEASDTATVSAEGTVVAGTDDDAVGCGDNTDAAAGNADDAVTDSDNGMKTDASPGSDLELNEPVTVEEHPTEHSSAHKFSAGGDGTDATTPEETADDVDGGLMVVVTDPEVAENLSADETLDPDVANEIAGIEAMLANLTTLTDADLIASVHGYARGAEGLAFLAVKTATCAHIQRWACGTILNRVKARCGHGNFTPWLTEHIFPLGISRSTCERAMQFARKYPDVPSLVAACSRLKEPHVACGIIGELPPAPAASDKPNAGEPNNQRATARLKHALLASVASLQSNIRRFSASGESLIAEEVDQIALAMIELTTFHDQLLDAGAEIQTQTAA